MICITIPLFRNGVFTIQGLLIWNKPPETKSLQVSIKLRGSRDKWHNVAQVHPAYDKYPCYEEHFAMKYCLQYRGILHRIL